MLTVSRLRSWNFKLALIWALLLCVLIAPLTSWVIAQNALLRPPTRIVAVAGDASTTLSWSGALGARMYAVYQSASPLKNTFTGAPVLYTLSPQGVVSGLRNGQKAYFVVRSMRGSEMSELSAPVVVLPMSPPPAPRMVSVAAGIESLALRWSRVSDARGYAVFRSETIHNFDYIAPLMRLNANTLAYLDRNVRVGVRYYYIVRAIGQVGQSMDSSEISAVPQGRPNADTSPHCDSPPHADTSPHRDASPDRNARRLLANFNARTHRHRDGASRPDKRPDSDKYSQAHSHAASNSDCHP